MGEFETAFARLNKNQLQAVQKIDGPLLVIAGPGTGKTQLLGMRIGHILKTTDTLPSDILCLTFTEAAASEMRDRLIKLIGQEAFSISISTYHAYGAEIMRKNPEYFEDADLELVEDLRSHLLLREIVARLPYSDPLKFADNYLRDIAAFISDCKQALLTPGNVKKIAQTNIAFIERASEAAADDLRTIRIVSKKSVPQFGNILKILESIDMPEVSGVLPLGHYCRQQLEAALGHYADTAQTSLLAQWKKDWLEKDAEGYFIFAGKRQNERLMSAAGIYRSYQEALKNSRLYDYDDMILRAITALEQNPDFKYSLAENYQYILLDEFQDTNKAQMRLVELLTDHPVHEGRPNVMAVGDDDQAIYAFQGADHANMAYFASHYRDTAVISLEENYRSHADIIEVSQAVVRQIENRLHQNFPGVDKVLVAANRALPKLPRISATEFKSDAAQYEWVADEIKRLVDDDKIAPRDIAVLAPKHKYLLPLLPCLLSRKLPVRYEKRENILDAPLVRQIEQMSRLTLAIAWGNESLASEIWPEVISYDFWELPTDRIWNISWQAKQAHEPWTKILLNDDKTRPIAELFLRLKDLAPLTSLEEMLDGLIGVEETSKKLGLPSLSPMFEYYFGKRGQAEPAEFTRLISHLNKLRDGLRTWQHGEQDILKLEDLVRYVEGHRAAGINILDQSPYYESAEAVNLLTAYGSKGREFKAVFVISANDDVWGSLSRNQGSRVSLPANLSHIRYQGASEDERLRLLFVAITRAMTHLYFTSYSQTLAGKSLTRLKYLDIAESDDGLSCGILPKSYAKVIMNDGEALTRPAAESYWAQRHIPPFRQNLKSALKVQLDRYQLSATHLNQFTDVVEAGPNIFFLKSILGFTSAPTTTSIYGTAIHNTLRWLGGSITKDGKRPSDKQVLDTFDRQLGQFRLPADEYRIQRDRGRGALGVWLKQSAKDLNPGDKYEYDFSGDAVFVGEAHLSGKIDRLIIDKKNRTIAVLDYKTGQSYSRWQPGVLKLHKFAQQLMVYKLLVENSTAFKGYEVTHGLIEFVEPDEHGRIVRLGLEYDSRQMSEIRDLVEAVWRRIKQLDFPDTSAFPKTVAGIRAFEKYLIDGRRS